MKMMCPMGRHFFISKEVIILELKSPTTYEEQVDLIKSKGFVISDIEKEDCIKFLQKINYYRLSAYSLPFRDKNGNYFPGISFSRIKNIYEFDSRMRGLIFSIIEDIEINIHTKLSYYVAHKYGALGYLSTEMFSNQHDSGRFKEKINSCISENSSTLVVKHHREKYDDQFPIWVIIEFFSIGMLSYFYKDMISADKKAIAAEMNTAPKLLESWLRCLTDLRNKCAHYTRLYYWSFTTLPAIPKSENIKADRKLFSQLLVLKYLYPTPQKWNSRFIIPLNALIDEYKTNISLSHIGFPENWMELLS